jgi:hypothetical protein
MTGHSYGKPSLWAPASWLQAACVATGDRCRPFSAHLTSSIMGLLRQGQREGGAAVAWPVRRLDACGESPDNAAMLAGIAGLRLMIICSIATG